MPDRCSRRDPAFPTPSLPPARLQNLRRPPHDRQACSKPSSRSFSPTLVTSLFLLSRREGPAHVTFRRAAPFSPTLRPAARPPPTPQGRQPRRPALCRARRALRLDRLVVVRRLSAHPAPRFASSATRLAARERSAATCASDARRAATLRDRLVVSLAPPVREAAAGAAGRRRVRGSPRCRRRRHELRYNHGRVYGDAEDPAAV